VIAAWWLQATVISTALALTAWTLESAFAALGRPRRWAWVAAMAATVVLTIAGPFRGASTLALHGTDQVALTVSDPSPLATATAWFGGLSLPNMDLPLLAIWAVVTITAVAIGLIAFGRALSRARLAPRAMLQGAAVRLTTDDGPMIVGLRDPEIVVPRSLLMQDPAAVRLVLAHEREHLAARDPWLLVGATMLVALLPGLPALWWMRARLRLAVELDCDHRVLARRPDHVAAYGDLLLSLASRQLLTSPGSLGLSLHPSTLERRIVAMTSRPARRWLPLLVIPITLGVVVACNAPLPTTEEQVALNTKVALTIPDGVEEIPIQGVPLRKQVLMLDNIKLDLSLADGASGVAEVEMVADSSFVLKLDGSKRPLLIKEVEGRRHP
jgi:beta-lactamase regulating signal transducer with metallopeptidase domain